MSTRGTIPCRPFGRAPEEVSMLGLGGFHLGKPSVTEKESIHLVRSAIDRGVTFLDNCWDYHGGDSEIRMGKALRDGYREHAFLMTKIDGRDRKTAAWQIEESLLRLDVDQIDLLQFHEIIRLSDPDHIFAEDGAWAAAEAAQRAGKVRYLGFTGHKSPEVHLRTLKVAADLGCRFDAVQMPLNLLDAHYDSFEKEVLPVLVAQGIAVLGMKPVANGRIAEKGLATTEECLHYALHLPTTVVITGCESMKDLDRAIAAARSFEPLTAKQVAALRAKTAPHAKKGEHESYKTTLDHDGTTEHPQWLGTS